jgi:3-oxoacyl-[acyl-carrier protein] reductase
MLRTEVSEQVVLITGGTRGIGYATAQAFLEAGARVAICGLNLERLEQAADELRTLGEVHAQGVDVAHYDAFSAFVAQLIERHGRLDVLVNNAGLAWAGEFVQQDPAAIGRHVDVNVKGVLYGAHAVLPPMLARGSGTIVNLASGAGRHGFASLATYCATKFAVVGFTEAVAQEVASGGVRVFAVCPGRVATDMQEEVFGRRTGVPPDHVAQAILSLAGPHPPIAPGQCLEVSR